MAATNTTSSMTVWHQDILEVTCSYLDASSIKALRLVNHGIGDIATPFLFRTLVLGLRKHRLKRLKWVSENEKFARGVREVWWDCAYYHDGSAPFDERLFIRGADALCLKLDFSTKSRKRRREKRHVLARYRALEKEEKQVLKAGLIGRMTEAFKRFPKLRRVEFVAWMYPRTEEGHVYSRSDFRGKMYEPPPLKALRSWYFSPERQLPFFELVLVTLKAAGRTIHHLGTQVIEGDANCRDDGLCGIRQLDREVLPVPYMLLAFDKLTPPALLVTAYALKNLRSLRLLLYADQAMLFTSATGRGRFRKILGEMAYLEEVELAFSGIVSHSLTDGEFQEIAIISLRDMFGSRTYAHLRHVCFRTFWLDADDLCDFLLRHMTTLQTVMLGNITLGGAANAERSSDGLGLYSLRERLFKCLCADWLLLGEACQQLQSLKGIDIWSGQPSTCKKCLPRMLQAVDIGMNGGPNVYERSLMSARRHVERRVGLSPADADSLGT